MDIAVAATGLVVTAPVQAAAALAVRRTMGTPVLFRQTRPGLHGKPFEMVKMRTMLLPSQVGGTGDDAARLTPLGRWLRATSIDELPTLWNVLRGDLSLVGPRPLLMDYLPLYSTDQMRRHEVRPGLTGLAQVSGRNALPWEERFTLDVEYVDRRCLGLDLQILARTIATVLGRGGVSAEGHATMPAFHGSAESATTAGGPR
ncbi:sugar transferase [Arsenicicoccus dermatophilus]|nr:sugar transferase [Arsenicicoccus dermatophilus]MCH8613717.1 sugar transferase [Arsenicicoccus dermatophilus]